MQAHSARKLRTAIITEPGAAHLDHYLETIAACDGLGPLAYADSTGATFEDARRMFGDCQTYKSLPDLLAQFQPRLAIVLPEAYHGPEWIRAALQAGCDVLSEKHPAADARHLHAMFSRAEERSRQLVLAFSNRAHQAVEKARDLLAAGAMGRLLGASMFVVADQTRLRDPVYRRSWRADHARAGGGILMALGIHHIDLLLYLTGASVRRVFSVCGNVGGAEVSIEDAAAVALELNSGAIATLHAGFYLDAAYQSRISLWFTGGWLELNFAEQPPLKWESFQEPGARTWTGESSREGKQTQVFFQKVIDSIRFDAEPVMRPRDGLHVLRTVFAAYESSESDLAVALESGTSMGA
jgi:predicted dehydrogenase